MRAGDISTGRSRGSSAQASDSGPESPDAPPEEHRRPQSHESAPETLPVDPAADADCVSEKGERLAYITEAIAPWSRFLQVILVRS